MTAAEVIEFGELPPDGRTGARGPYGKWARIAEQLRQRPGVWAKCDTYSTPNGASNAARNVRKGSYSAMPAGEFEATARGLDVWMRYIGRAA